MNDQPPEDNFDDKPDENFDPENSGNPSNDPSQQPLHAQFQHRAVTARLREDVRGGAFANATIVLSGNFEFVLDFILRLGKPDLVTARVVLPIPVADQFVKALGDSLNNYERQFGAIPDIPAPEKNSSDAKSEAAKNPDAAMQHDIGGFVGATTPEGTVTREDKKGHSQNIDDIYDDLKLEDEILGGVYANAVLLRHSATEFCFDFVTNIYPKSSVNARVFMAVPQVKPLWNALSHSLNQFHNRQSPPSEEE